MQTGLMLYKDKTDADNEERFSCLDCLGYYMKRGWEIDENFTCGDPLDTLVLNCLSCGEQAVQGTY